MPLSLKILAVLLSLQIFFAAFLVSVAFIGSAAPASSGFWLEVEDSLARRAGTEHIQELSAGKLGEITGTFIFPQILSVLALFYLNKRKRTGVFVCLFLNILLILGNQGFPLFSTICLILLYLPGCRAYFLRLPPIPPSFAMQK